MTGRPLKADMGLEPYATPTQLRYLQALNEHGSARAAAKALGLSAPTSITHAYECLQKNAARAGYAPGHFADGVAPGYLMGKVTVQRGPGGVERTWERMSPEAGALQQALEAAAAAMAQEVPRLALMPAPALTLGDLLNLYTLTDCHIGMRAWRLEGGADWDLAIAERTILGCFEQMIAQAPAARVGVVNQLGDFLHWDGPLPVTPTSGHVLDADGRFSKVVQAAIRILRRVVDLALQKHEEVHLIVAEGNHDLASSMWLRHMFAALYEREPRLQVNSSELPYYVHQHGRVMLGFHHGHKAKPDSLPLLFAAQYAEVWGLTRRRYIHTGHVHHEHLKEHAGVKVVGHPTLAARDAHAARGGWLSDQQASVITYHAERGKVGEVVVSPEMLD